MDTLAIQTPYIQLQSTLKLAGWVSTGGEAKKAILDGQVLVNGNACLQRGKKLYEGDIVSFQQKTVVICNSPN